MASAADREAFLRLMGLSDADVADPDLPARPALHSNSASAKAMPGRTAYGAKPTSPATSSLAGLSHSASLTGDAVRASMMGTTGSGTGRGAASSRPYASPPRSVRWEEESIAATCRANAPSHNAGAQRGGAAAAALSEELKEKGNRAFESGAFRDAVQHYTSAIEALATSSVPSAAEVQLLAALHSNRSAAYLQAAHQLANTEEAYGRALCDADRTVALRSSWFKGHARQGDAYFKLKRYGPAAESYEMALQLDPDNHTLVNALAEARQRAKHAAREELEMRRSMRSTTASGASSLMSTMNGSQDGPAAWGDGDVRAQVTSSQRDYASTTGASAGRRRSGQAQQLWAELKHEVESTVHEATGDAYRLQQLEKFRARGSGTPTPTAGRTAAAARAAAASRLAAEGSRATSTTRVTPEAPSAPPSAGAASEAPRPPPRPRATTSPTAGGVPAVMATFDGPVHNARDVPYEFSSAAASAYQQQLLEKFRQRKATNK